KQLTRLAASPSSSRFFRQTDVLRRELPNTKFIEALGNSRGATRGKDQTGARVSQTLKRGAGTIVLEIFLTESPYPSNSLQLSHPFAAARQISNGQKLQSIRPSQDN